MLHKAVWTVTDFMSWPSPQSSDRPFQPISCKSLSCHVGLTFLKFPRRSRRIFWWRLPPNCSFLCPPFLPSKPGRPWGALERIREVALDVGVVQGEVCAPEAAWDAVSSKQPSALPPFQWLKVSVCRCKKPSWRIWSRFLMLMQAALLHRQALPNSKNVHIEF